MKARTISALLAVLMCLTFASCGFTPAPEKDLEKMLGHLSKGQVSRAERYVWEGTLHYSDKNRDAKNLRNTVFTSIAYTVSDSVIVGDVAYVNATITVIDMREIVHQASLEALDSALTNRRLYNMVTQKAKSDVAQSATHIVSVYMVRDGGRWKVVMSGNELFAEAISGGIPEFVVQ